MADKNLKTRIQLKNDTETNWNKATNFIPKKGEVIIYNPDNERTYPRIKIGDGITTVINLPFANMQSNWTDNDTTSPGYIKNKPALGSAASTNSTDYATSAQGLKADQAMPKSGGTFTGSVILNAAPVEDMEPATKKYVDDYIAIGGTLGTGTQIGILTINGIQTTLYIPNAAPMTVQVTQSNNTPTAEFIVSTNTASGSELLGVLATTDTLSNGKIIYYMTKYALPAAATTIKLNYANSGNNTGSIPIYMYGTTQSNIEFPAGCLLTLVYYNNAFYLASNNLAVTN